MNATTNDDGEGTRTRLAVVCCIALLVGGVALAGTAGAVDDVVEIEISPGEVDVDTGEETHELSFEATDVAVNESDVTTVTIDLSEGYDAEAHGQLLDVAAVSFEGADGETIEIEDESVESDDGLVEYELTAADDGVDTIDLVGEVDLDLEHPDIAGTSTIDISVGDREGAEAIDTVNIETTSIENIEYVVDGDPIEDPERPEDFVFRGQIVTAVNLTPDELYTLTRVEEFDGNDIVDKAPPVKTIRSDEDGNVTIDTTHLDHVDAYYFLSGDIDDEPIEEVRGNTFQLFEQDILAEFGDQEVPTAGDPDDVRTTLDIGSPLRQTYSLNVSVDGDNDVELDAEDLYQILTDGQDPDAATRTTPDELDRGEGPLGVALYEDHIDGSEDTVVLVDIEEGPTDVTFEGIPMAGYTFNFEVSDAVTEEELPASDTAVIDVVAPVPEGTGEFDQDVYETPAGDFITVDLSVNGLDEAYVLIGGDRQHGDPGLQGYVDVLHIEGDTTVTINTRLLGTDVPSDRVYLSDSPITSYDHDLGATEEPSGVFGALEFDDVRASPAPDEDLQSLADLRDELEISTISRPLQPDRYRLVAGVGPVVIRDDEVPTFDQQLARTNVVLEEPELGEITTYVAPRGPADHGPGLDMGNLLGSATERDTVAKGDRLIVEVEAVGMWGALAAHSWRAPEELLVDPYGRFGPEAIVGLHKTHEGVFLNVSQPEADTTANRDPNLVDFGEVTDEQVFFYPEVDLNGEDDPTIERYYAVVDTRGSGLLDQTSGPFDNSPADGERFRVEKSYESPRGDRFQFREGSGQPAPFAQAVGPSEDPNSDLERYPYFDVEDGTETIVRDFFVEEPYAEYDRVSDEGEVVLPEVEDATIMGTTNVAPSSDFIIQLVDNDEEPPRTVTIEDVTVDEGGNFTASHDLSAIDFGEDVDVEFYADRTIEPEVDDERLIDKRSAVIVEDIDNPIVFEIDEHTENVTATTGDRLTVEATIDNTGDLGGRQVVELLRDGEPIDQRTPRLDAGEERTIELDGGIVTAEPGEYEYAIETPDDEATGELLVEDTADPAFFEVVELDPETVSVDAGEPFGVNATVANAGETFDRQAIELQVDGEPVDAQELTIGGEDDRVVEFEAIETDDLEPGNYTLGVFSEDDAAEGTLRIEADRDPDDEAATDDEESDVDEEEGVSEPEEEPEPDDESAGLFPVLGIGLRDAMGGTAIAGAIYVLDAVL